MPPQDWLAVSVSPLLPAGPLTGDHMLRRINAHLRLGPSELLQKTLEIGHPSHMTLRD